MINAAPISTTATPSATVASILRTGQHAQAADIARAAGLPLACVRRALAYLQGRGRVQSLRTPQPAGHCKRGRPPCLYAWAVASPAPFLFDQHLRAVWR